MQQDPLSDVLRSVHLRGAVFFYVSYPDDWVAEAPPARAPSRARRASAGPGSSAVLERVSEMVFVDAARRYL